MNLVLFVSYKYSGARWPVYPVGKYLPQTLTTSPLRILKTAEAANIDICEICA